jgi:hypothetical protein
VPFGSLTYYEKPATLYSKMPHMKSPRIKFAPTLVTGVSRPLNNDEHWTLYYFEDHAAKCVCCYSPYQVYKHGRRLCEEGRELAISVAGLLFKLSQDGHIYSKSADEHQYIRIEMPAKYEHVSELFKAIEKSKNSILHRPISLDRHYPVRPRLPSLRAAAGPAPHEYESRPVQYLVPAEDLYGRRAADDTYSPRRSYYRNSHHSSRDSARWSRGSLFDGDQKAQQQRELRERRAHYDYAVPVYRYSMWDHR